MRYETLLLYYAMPYFTLSMIVELIYALWKGEKMRTMDVVSSLSSGMTNILKATLGLTIGIISYTFLLDHLGLFHWKAAPWWMYGVVFVYIDLVGYTVHRIEHRVNFFWNQHIVHHSSEEFNLACALRQPFSDIIGFFTILLLPLALLGVPFLVIAIVAPIHLFLQFWYHTRYIKRIGFLEKIIVTPSHHRVHHAMNGVYLDKNFGQIFIFWDKLFGTYQEELEELEPVYGVKRPVRTWNPIVINFKHLWLLIVDAWRTESYRDKLRIWFMPTGWRPADVEAKYPLHVVEDFKTFEKFDPVYSVAFMIWSFVQMAFTLVMLGFLFYRIEAVHGTEKMLYGGYLLIAIFAYTAVMDRKIYGVAAMILQAALGIAIVVKTGDWFGMANIWHYGPALLIAFWLASTASCIFFMLREFDLGQARQPVRSEV